MLLRLIKGELPPGDELEITFGSTHYKFGVHRAGRLLGFVIVSSSPRSVENEIKAAMADCRRLIRGGRK